MVLPILGCWAYVPCVVGRWCLGDHYPLPPHLLDPSNR